MNAGAVDAAAKARAEASRAALADHQGPGQSAFGDVGAAELARREVAADRVAGLELDDRRFDHVARTLDE